MDTLGQRIVRLRKENHYTQEDIAKATGVNQSTIGRIESGKLLPSSDLIVIMAELFHTNFDYLLTGKNANTHNDSDSDCNINISEEELTLLKLYNSLSKHDQNEILGIINLKLSSQKKDNSSIYQTTGNHIETA